MRNVDMFQPLTADATKTPAGGQFSPELAAAVKAVWPDAQVLYLGPTCNGPVAIVGSRNYAKDLYRAVERFDPLAMPV